MRFKNVKALVAITLALVLALVAACGGAAPQATSAPAPTAAPLATAMAEEATQAPAAATPSGGSAAATPVPQAAVTSPPAPAASHTPTGDLRVAMATFGNERWIPGASAGAEDTAFHSILENLLTRNPETGDNIGSLRSPGKSATAGWLGSSGCAKARSGITAKAR